MAVSLPPPPRKPKRFCDTCASAKTLRLRPPRQVVTYRSFGRVASFCTSGVILNAENEGRSNRAV